MNIQQGLRYRLVINVSRKSVVPNVKIVIAREKVDKLLDVDLNQLLRIIYLLVGYSSGRRDSTVPVNIVIIIIVGTNIAYGKYFAP